MMPMVTSGNFNGDDGTPSVGTYLISNRIIRNTTAMNQRIQYTSNDKLRSKTQTDTSNSKTYQDV